MWFRSRRPPLGVMSAIAAAVAFHAYGLDPDPWVAASVHVENGEWWRLFTSWVVHRGVWHLLFNVWAVGVIGWPLEKDGGWVRFAVVFIGGAAAGNLLEVLMADTAIAVIGSSGGVFALAGVWLGWSVKHFFTPMGGTVLGVLLLFLGASVLVQLAFSDLAWWAHLGGLGWGVLCQWAIPEPHDREVVSPGGFS